MDPTRAGAVLARHAGIDEETGQLADDGDGPRRLVISSDFYSVCTSAGKKADGLVNLYCSPALAWNDSCPGTPRPPTCAPGHNRPRPADTGTAGLTTAPPLRTGHADYQHACDKAG